jgi:hypothetical protein
MIMADLGYRVAIFVVGNSGPINGQLSHLCLQRLIFTPG